MTRSTLPATSNHGIVTRARSATAVESSKSVMIAAGASPAERTALVELRRFFDRAIRASFDDLALRDDPAAPYLADLLTRFARTETLYPPGRAVPRLETVVDMLLDAQAVWHADSPYFEPEQELAIRRHIGDYTLFMMGVFRERVERLASTGHYI